MKTYQEHVDNYNKAISNSVRASIKRYAKRSFPLVFEVSDFVGKERRKEQTQTITCTCGLVREVPLWRVRRKKQGALCQKCAILKSTFDRAQGWTNSNGYEAKKIKDDDPFISMGIRGPKGRASIAVHRYVMAQHLGRPLTPDELVHHIDGNKLNNDISNLELTTSSEHHKEHWKTWIRHGWGGPITKEE